MSFFNRKTNEDQNSSTNLVNNFLTKSEGLQRILEKETEYFRNMKIKQAEMLVQSKIELIEHIESIKASFAANPQIVKGLAEIEKKQLRQANNNLMKAAEDNYKETMRAREINKLVLEAIAYAVTQANGIEGAYGENGNTYKQESAKPISVSQNA